MNQKVQDDMYKEYPYLQNFRDYSIFLSENEYKELMSGPRLKGGNLEVSIKLLNELLMSDLGYDYVKRCVEKEINEVDISYIIYGDTTGTIRLNRTSIVLFCDEAIKRGMMELTTMLQERLDYMRSKMSYELYREEHQENFSVKADGTKYVIPAKLLFNVLEMSDEELIKICSNPKMTHIGEYPKAPLIYAVITFFDNGCMNEYLFPPRLKKRLNDLKQNIFIDVQAINKHPKIDDVNQANVIINEELKRAIFSDMPRDLSKIEQAIYIYIKMCKILSYDEEFYVLDQKVPKDHKHHQISYIKEISPSNSQVVCYEFNAIYAKLLESIGINFTIDYKDVVGQEYGVSHASLEWRFHKFLVKADSAETFLGSDMIQAKLNQPLNGLKCLNYNKETREEFSHLVSRVYRIIALKENKDAKDIEHIETLDDLLKDYDSYTTNFREVTLVEKIDIFFNKMKKEHLTGIDLLAYVLQLSKIIFNEEEQKNNVNVVIIRKNNKDGVSAKPVAVLVVNTRSISEYSEENEYFIYDSDGHLSSIDIYDLQERFDEEQLAYINPARDIEISGISKGGKA